MTATPTNVITPPAAPPVAEGEVSQRNCRALKRRTEIKRNNTTLHCTRRERCHANAIFPPARDERPFLCV